MKKWYLYFGYPNSFEPMFLETPENDNEDLKVYGPYDTFTAVKNDALEMLRADISEAQASVNEIKGWKKGEYN